MFSTWIKWFGGLKCCVDFWWGSSCCRGWCDWWYNGGSSTSKVSKEVHPMLSWDLSLLVKAMPKFRSARRHYRESSYRPPPQRFEAIKITCTAGRIVKPSAERFAWRLSTWTSLVSGATQNLMMAAPSWRCGRQKCCANRNCWPRHPSLNENGSQGQGSWYQKQFKQWLVCRGTPWYDSIMWHRPYRSRDLGSGSQARTGEWCPCSRCSLGKHCPFWFPKLLEMGVEVRESLKKDPCSFSTENLRLVHVNLTTSRIPNRDVYNLQMTTVAKGESTMVGNEVWESSSNT